MSCREQFLDQSSWRERRAAHEEIRLEARSDFHGARHSCRGRREFASVVRIGLVQIRGCSMAEAGRICDPVGGETLVSGRARNLPHTAGCMFLGQVINRFSCFLRVHAASKLTDQVGESFTGRESLTKLHSMVPHYDKKKIGLWFGLFAAFCHVQLVDGSGTEQAHKRRMSLVMVQFGRSYKWIIPAASAAVAPAVAVVQLASCGKNTDLDCASSSVDALCD